MKPIATLITLLLLFFFKEKQSEDVVAKNQKVNKIPVIDSAYVATKTAYFKIKNGI